MILLHPRYKPTKEVQMPAQHAYPRDKVHAETTFYGEMICAFMEAEGVEEEIKDFDVLQDAMGLSDEEFSVGMDWCLSLGIITYDEPAPRVD
jgi:hypothetical protein